MKCDLHIHTRHSRRSAEWLLRQFDFPDSVSDPHRLHALLREKGMDLVTFTDHNTIDACLEVADLPGTFVSEEVTTYFPGDRCKIHLLVWGIDEAQHREIGQLRPNIFELQGFLAQQGIAHAVAHPLYRVQQQFDRSHLEKLLLLFRHFEGLNGLRNGMFNDTFRFLLEHLTPVRMEQMAARHDLEPTHSEPWKKVLTGGSDDHGGIFPASAWTEVAGKQSDLSTFLAAVRTGECLPGGQGGTPLALSHSLYNTIYFFCKERFVKKPSPGTDLIEKAFSRFMEGHDPTEFTMMEKIGFVTQGILSGKIFELAKPGNASLWKELTDYIGKPDLKQILNEETDGVEEPERRAFLMANTIANQLAFRFFEKCVREFSSGNPIEGMQSISALVPMIAVLSPYIYSFQSQTPNRRWLESLCNEMTGELPHFLQNNKRAWATDTLDDVNGVATTIQKMTAAATHAGKNLEVITCSSHPHEHGIPVHNFQPIGEFSLPEYELQKLSFPPVLQILDYIQRGNFSEVIISTPGPTGLASLLAAKMLGLKTSGIYHTDFPQYVRILTDDGFLETLTWNFMHWFYSQLDLVYVNSEHYRRCWIERGIPAEKIRILPRGLDLELFRPERRDPQFWKSRGLQPGEIGALYVGRISKEKDLEDIIRVDSKLQSAGIRIRFLFIGDGPYRAELEKELPRGIFTGYLEGEVLAQGYASADLFAFPSTTDTFGNVILEAMAAGLPCVVSDVGGPSELVEDGKTGFIVHAHDINGFVSALKKLAGSDALRSEMSLAARESVSTRNWDRAFQAFWNRG
jgi:glycosyltransferase involved in cell wall biosynthesis